MKASILFFSSVFLLLSCSTKPDEKELKLYNRILNDEIEEVKHSLQKMSYQIHRYQYHKDTIILINAQNLVSKVDLLLDSNQIRKACQIVYNELKKVDSEIINEKYDTMNELLYLDSLYGIRKDTLTILKYRNSIYNALNFVVVDKAHNLNYDCSFTAPTQVMYNTNDYKLNDTLEMIILPGAFIYMNTVMPRTNDFPRALNLSVDFKNYFLVNNKTNDCCYNETNERHIGTICSN